MNIFHLEEKKIELIEKLLYEKFPLSRLELVNSFILEVLNSEDKTIIEAYLSEFNSEYLISVKNLSPLGLPPHIINKTINFIEKIPHEFKSGVLDQKIFHEIKRIKNDYHYVENSLDGNIVHYNKDLISFPVIIQTLYNDQKFGQIETFSIKIHKDSSLKRNKFIIIPSSDKIDDRLKNQIEISWNLAIDYLKEFYKSPSNYHEVILIFEHKYAEMEGFSLGLAITLGFIQELFRFYNTSLSLKLNANVTFTGGIQNDKSVIKLGEEIIGTKVETVFFSYHDYLGIPEQDYLFAKNKFESLKELYPKRNLKLIPLSDFNDMISHRQIISINKAKIIERTRKTIKSHSLTFLLFAVLLIMLGAIFFYSYDNNPIEFERVGGLLNILNKSGKILWSKPIGLAHEKRMLEGKYFQRIYDINNDGLNEVIIAHENLAEKDVENHGRIACFDYEGNLLWKYKFRDTVSTATESFGDFYVSRLVDIVEYKNKTVLFCNARHTYFPSAIYLLDISNGKRLHGLLWSQGHFTAGNIGDYDKDGEKEIFIGGINNGLEMAFACIINLANLNGQTPTTKNYLFKDIPFANFKKYFIIPKSDLCIFSGRRFNGTELTKFYEETKSYHVGVNEKYKDIGVGAYYIFNYNLDSVKLQIGDAQQFVRDSLIIKGLLNPPFTTDPEYEKILTSKIKEWNGKEFIPFMNIK